MTIAAVKCSVSYLTVSKLKSIQSFSRHFDYLVSSLCFRLGITGKTKRLSTTEIKISQFDIHANFWQFYILLFAYD